MRRAGGWFLGFIAVLAMGAGGWFALRPVITRPAVRVAFLPPEMQPSPAFEAMRSGAMCAFDEAGFRAGKFRFEAFTAADAKCYEPDVAAWIGLFPEDSPPRGFVGGSIPISQIPPMRPMIALFEGSAEPRLAPSRYETGMRAAEWARWQGARRVCLLEGNVEVALAFRRHASTVGLEIVDLALNGAADLVFFSGEDPPYGDAFKLFDALKSQGFLGRLLVADSTPEMSFLDASGSVVEGTYLISSLTPPPADFIPKYQAFAGKLPGPHVYYGYLAGRAVIDAIDRSGTDDPGTLRKRLSFRLPINPCAVYVYRDGKFEFVECLK